MADLVLHLKREYFDQIKRGEKIEEYRLVTDYWKKRLEGRRYQFVVLLCGYPSRKDESRRIIYSWKGYTKKTITHQQFGDKPVEVFAIAISEDVGRPRGEYLKRCGWCLATNYESSTICTVCGYAFR